MVCRTRAAAPVARMALKRAHTVKPAEQILLPELRRGPPKNVLLAHWAGSSLLFHDSAENEFPMSSSGSGIQSGARFWCQGWDTWAAGSTEPSLCFVNLVIVSNLQVNSSSNKGFWCTWGFILPLCSTCLFNSLCNNLSFLAGFIFSALHWFNNVNPPPAIKAENTLWIFIFYSKFC